MSNILFVDDDIDFLEINARYFTKEGHNVKISSTSEHVFRLLKSFQPDCIVLDVMMPGMNGFEVCKRIRSFSRVPIIFLSARTGENDRIKGLILGGDDYLVKPYSFRELSARIRVQLRHNSRIDANRISYPPLSLDLKQHKAFYNNEDILLSNREYDLLLLLVTNANQVVTYEAISNHIWGTYTESDRKTIMVIASRLRKKLDSYQELTNNIESVWSKGYTFNIKQESL
ncbi:MAG: response regulator transcription factor [Clostridiales bacterium]|jgi:DNA-binding response OmpR family regulator|nr:response regulator transcription factor [Clostridiales bacterium]